jgi:hypothetical protein
MQSGADLPEAEPIAANKAGLQQPHLNGLQQGLPRSAHIIERVCSRLTQRRTLRCLFLPVHLAFGLVSKLLRYHTDESGLHLDATDDKAPLAALLPAAYLRAGSDLHSLVA